MDKTVNKISLNPEPVKTTVRDHLTPIRMAVIKKQKASVGKRVERLRHPYALLGGMENDAPAVENIMAGPQKFKHRMTM